MPHNVLGTALQACSFDPLTGWNRDGFCTHRKEDGGRHLVCAKMNKSFLEYTASKGNDLSTPRDGFPGLAENDRWCICAGRYSEAAIAGAAPDVVLEATNKEALRWRLVRDLLGHAT